MSLLKANRRSVRLNLSPLPLRARSLHPSPTAPAKPLPPRIKFDEEEIREAFVHGSGPGGQKINKTACAVQLKHIPTGIITTCQETRSRSQNRKIARKVLAEKVESLEKGSESRTAIKAQIKSRKKASKSKKARRKYKAAKQGQEEDEEEVDEREGKGEEGLETDKVEEQRVG